MISVTALQPTTRFERDVKGLPPEVREAVRIALGQLLLDPVPKSLRHHVLGGFRPKIHVIDVTPNHAYQITFECLDGGVARLLKVGSHRSIDRSPR